MSISPVSRPAYSQETPTTGNRVPAAVGFKQSSRSSSGLFLVIFLLGGLLVAGTVWALFLRDSGQGALAGSARAMAEALRLNTCSSLPSLSRNEADPKQLLEQLRTDLANAGVAWDKSRGVAFGGVRARVGEGEALTDSVVGDLYIDAEGKIWRIEVTMRRTDDHGFVLADVWSGSPLEATAEQVKGDAEQRFTQFKQDQRQANGGPEVRRPKFTFVTL